MQQLARRSLAALLALSLVSAETLAPSIALADDNTSADASLSELQQKVESSAQAYADAQSHLADVNQQIADNQAKIEEIEAQLPDMKEKAADSMKTLYKMGQSSGDLVNLVLSSEDFNQMLAIMQYLNIIEKKNSGALNDLLAAKDELQNTKAALESEQTEAESAKNAAEQAMDDAISAREAAQKAAEEKAAKEAAEAAKAVEEAKAKAGQTFTTESGQTATVEAPKSNDSSSSNSSSSNNSSSNNSSNSATDSGDVNFSERDQFVASWTTRIDNYLAGSPLAGHGKTFAEAAWDYGVDPRWSPAISTIESSTGRVCFRPYNAWGWGNVSWPDWDTAIRAHVRGLASGYGYTLTMAAAQKYCPPTASLWYSAVLAQMQSI